MVDRIAKIWGTRTPYARDGLWPVRVDQALDDGVTEADVDRWVQSACVLCSNGCACDIAVKDGAMVGDPRPRRRPGQPRPAGPEGPLRQLAGRCPRDRLTRPLIRENGQLVEMRLGHGHGPDRRAQPSDCWRERGPLSHGFYTSGQLFLEEYYALAVIGKAGIGTPHMDGNTRLCTATAAAALKESFGADGQPGLLRRHRQLRRHLPLRPQHGRDADGAVVAGARPPRRPGPARSSASIPRDTEVASHADVHLRRPARHQPRPDERPGPRSPRQRLGRCRTTSRDAHPRPGRAPGGGRAVDGRGGGRDLRRRAADIREAARIFGTSDRVLSTVLQGFYQSAQATAASCQVNNLHLLRGMLGRPGCGILQMNGQPTAQNNRECGADGDLPGFRNWDNPDHIAGTGRALERGPDDHPALGAADPRHADLPLRRAGLDRASSGSRRPTRPCPCPSCPGSGTSWPNRSCFLVVQDLYLTETAQFADVVLPGAGWGEKTGTFTNVNRTVHLSDKAVEPPGEARSDLDIFLDYARRMDFTHPGRRPAAALDRARGRLRGLEGMLPRPALRLHRHQLRQAPRRQRHPLALQRRASGRHGPALRGRRLPHGPGLLRKLRPRPAHRRHGRRRRPSAPRRPAAGRCSRPRTTTPRTRSPTTTTRCGTRPAAPPTTSTPAPRPAAPGR